MERACLYQRDGNYFINIYIIMMVPIKMSHLQTTFEIDDIGIYPRHNEHSKYSAAMP